MTTWICDPWLPRRRNRTATASAAGRADVETELVRALTGGPGVVAFSDAFSDSAVVDRATGAFDQIIAAERAAGGGRNDHFAKAGANDRIWNALEKLAVRDPETFVDYYGNDVLALISTAWLGPAYQVTSQVNVVRPGGKAQDPHRDYHLGFLSNETAARYPAHVHLIMLPGSAEHGKRTLDRAPRSPPRRVAGFCGSRVRIPCWVGLPGKLERTVIWWAILGSNQ